MLEPALRTKGAEAPGGLERGRRVGERRPARGRDRHRGDRIGHQGGRGEAHNDAGEGGLFSEEQELQNVKHP